MTKSQELWDALRNSMGNVQFPHCDSRILHPPKISDYCDRHPEWQRYRVAHKMLFTGEEPREGWLPCPADESRPPGAGNDHRHWAGNKPTSATGDPSWPTESFASQIMYGDKGGRA